MADVCAKEAALRSIRAGVDTGQRYRVSLAFLKAQCSEYQTEDPGRGSISPQEFGITLLPVIGRTCNDRSLPQENRMGWVRFVLRRSKSRQSRENLFKECVAWKPEIRLLWKRVGEASLEKDNAGKIARSI